MKITESLASVATVIAFTYFCNAKADSTGYNVYWGRFMNGRPDDLDTFYYAWARKFVVTNPETGAGKIQCTIESQKARDILYPDSAMIERYSRLSNSQYLWFEKTDFDKTKDCFVIPPGSGTVCVHDYKFGCGKIRNETLQIVRDIRLEISEECISYGFNSAEVNRCRERESAAGKDVWVRVRELFQVQVDEIATDVFDCKCEMPEVWGVDRTVFLPRIFYDVYYI